MGGVEAARKQKRMSAQVVEDETSDAVKLSSCLGKFPCRVGEGGSLVVVSADG
jgi:hypothetical protein